MLDALFLSVGAMKCGTTWLYEQLKHHPEICFTPEKEIHYFAHQQERFDLLSLESRVGRFHNFFQSQNNFSLDFFLEHLTEVEWYAHYATHQPIEDKWYQDLFRFKSSQAKYCADFCNLNSQLDRNGWRHVRRNCVDLKVLYTIRDPLERAWSHYKFHMQTINRSADITTDFEHFVELCEQEWFWQFARYDDAIARLQSNLSPEELLIAYFEDFRASPHQSIVSLCDFLGIANNWSDTEISPEKVNASAELAPPPRFLEFLQEKTLPIYTSLKRMGYSHARWTKY